MSEMQLSICFRYVMIVERNSAMEQHAISFSMMIARFVQHIAWLKYRVKCPRYQKTHGPILGVGDGDYCLIAECLWHTCNVLATACSMLSDSLLNACCGVAASLPFFCVCLLLDSCVLSAPLLHNRCMLAISLLCPFCFDSYIRNINFTNDFLLIPILLSLGCSKEFNFFFQRPEVCEETDQEEKNNKKKKSISKNGKKKK